jgi:hypothetical protein
VHVRLCWIRSYSSRRKQSFSLFKTKEGARQGQVFEASGRGGTFEVRGGGALSKSPISYPDNNLTRCFVRGRLTQPLAGARQDGLNFRSFSTALIGSASRTLINPLDLRQGRATEHRNDRSTDLAHHQPTQQSGNHEQTAGHSVKSPATQAFQKLLPHRWHSAFQQILFRDERPRQPRV